MSAVLERAAGALDDLLDDLASFELDPLGFVMWAFPWGDPETSLADETGPDQWQLGVLTRVGEKLRAGGDAGAIIHEAVTSGHGVGKSALVSWMILWAISTLANTRGVVTANTETQLRTKTWAELGKWHALFVARDLFAFTATAIYSSDPASQKTWRIDAIPWSVDRAESFAGLHNKGRRILLIFDEASGIDQVIWDTARGALTDADTQIVWCVFGNPTRTSGQFHAAVTEERSAWTVTKVDSRTSKFSNKALLKLWAEQYGEDSDFFRVRVRGEFPRAGSANFISPDVVRAAMRRELALADYQAMPKVIAVDPADLGGDKTAIVVRQGGKVLEMQKFSGADTVELTRIVSDLWMKYRDAQAVVIDAIGVGTGLAANLERVPGMPVVRCNVSIPMPADHRCMNLRADLWWRMREWIEHAEIPDDEDLRRDLCDMEYGYDGRMRVQLESKKDIRAAGRPSPDCGDALALSFFVDTIARTTVHAKVRPTGNRKVIWSRNR